MSEPEDKPRSQWPRVHVARFTNWLLSPRGGVYCAHRGGWARIVDFCLDDPEQGPVVALPIFRVGA